MCIAAPALADDSEIYLSGSPATGAKPNVLLIVDNSGSMGANDATGERREYNPGHHVRDVRATVLPGAFSSAARERLSPTARRPTTSRRRLTTAGSSQTAVGSAGRSGRWTGKSARYDTAATTWIDLVGGGTTAEVECFADNSVHGSECRLHAQHLCAQRFGDRQVELAVVERHRLVGAHDLQLLLGELAQLVSRRACRPHRVARPGGGERGCEPRLVRRRREHGPHAIQPG